ncbi:MAG: DUF6263 family protein [Sedimentisphaerales bacterium]
MTNLELRIREESKKQKAKSKNAEKEQFNFVFFHIFTFCFLIFTFFCRSAAAETPGFNFKPGDKYLLTSVTEEKITRNIDANQQVINRTIRFGCDFDIEEVDENGVAWGKYTYRRTGQKITGPDIDVDFDSNTPTKTISRQSLPMLLVIKERLYIRISPQGRVDKINGLQAVLSNVNSNVPRMSDRDKLTITNAIDEMLSESSIKRTLEEQLAVFPDPSRLGVEPRQGANHNPEWSRTVEVPAKKTVQKWSYRLKSSKDGITIVDVNLDITPSADTQEVVRGGIKYRYQASGQGQGQIEINLNATGPRPIVKSVITQDLTEELKVSSQGPLLRVPKIVEPVQTHIVSTLLMTRRESQAKTGELNQPVDTNH